MLHTLVSYLIIPERKVTEVNCFKGYLHYTQNGDVFFVLLAILAIEISISNIIRDLHSSEIRENGVYGSGHFYKWAKVESYSWILPTTIHFEVNTFFKTNYSFEFTIKEELKSKVNETVQKAKNIDYRFK